MTVACFLCNPEQILSTPRISTSVVTIKNDFLNYFDSISEVFRVLHFMNEKCNSMLDYALHVVLKFPNKNPLKIDKSSYININLKKYATSNIKVTSNKRKFRTYNKFFFLH